MKLDKFGIILWAGLIVMIGNPIFMINVADSAVIESKGELKDRCGVYDGVWEDGECKFDNEEDKAAYEDYICDDPDSYKVEEVAEICER